MGHNILFLSLFFLLVQVISMPLNVNVTYFLTTTTQSPLTNLSLFLPLEFSDDFDIEVKRDREGKTFGALGGGGGNSGGGGGGGCGLCGGGGGGATTAGAGAAAGMKNSSMLNFNKLFGRISNVVNISKDGVLTADLGQVASKAFNMIPAMIRKPLTGIIRRIIQSDNEDEAGSGILAQKAAIKGQKASAKGNIIRQKAAVKAGGGGGGGGGGKVDVGVSAGGTDVKVGVGGYSKGDEEEEEEWDDESRRRRRSLHVFRFTYR